MCSVQERSLVSLPSGSPLSLLYLSFSTRINRRLMGATLTLSCTLCCLACAVAVPSPCHRAGTGFCTAMYHCGGCSEEEPS